MFGLGFWLEILVFVRVNKENVCYSRSGEQGSPRQN